MRETRWLAQALEAIQLVAEAHLRDLFGDIVLAAIHAKRVTITCQDMDVSRRISGNTLRDGSTI